MKNIIRKKQYSIGLAFVASNILMTNSGLALELALPSIVSPLIENNANNKSLHYSKHNQAPSFVTLQSANENVLSNFQERYLTYRHSKHEHIKAIFDQGAYYIKYQQNW